MVTLEKFTQVAAVGNGRKRHALLSGEWMYSGGGINITRCLREATAVEYRQSGRPVPMDCRGCAGARK